MEFTGMVIKSTGSWYQVLYGSEVISCKIKGNFRIKGFVTTNPIAVGDKVDFVIKKEENTGFITNIHDRKNYIIRKSINLSRQAHIIAANVDLALLMVTINKPETHTVFIDRFLVSCEAYNIPVLIVFNKTDIYSALEIEKMEEWIDLYEKIGYPSIKVSALLGQNIETLKNILKDKNTVISGNSGVGKSTLINAIEPTLMVKTDEISDYHQKGKHTTTFSEVFTLSFGGFIIDTPGIKGYGLVDLQEENLATYFPEMLKLQTSCKYYNCTHTHEPGCKVVEAVRNNDIAESRYKSYLSMLFEDSGKYRDDSYR
jgi:ribosome biogenesis GTPase / thiamine phosphate phosphatase